MRTPRGWVWLLGALGLIGLAVGIAFWIPPSPQTFPPSLGLASKTPVAEPMSEPGSAPKISAPEVPSAVPAATALVSTIPSTSTALPDSPPGIDASGTYTILAGDTLWAIGVKFGVSLEQLVAANPGLDPNLIQPGHAIHIPAPGEVIPTAIAPGSLVTGSSQLADTAPSPAEVAPVTEISTTFQANARVKPDADNLRVRALPNAEAAVLRKLAAQTPLSIAGRTADGAWLQVRMADGQQGWVMAQFVEDWRAELSPASASVPASTPASTPTNAVADPTMPSALATLDVHPGRPVALSTASLPRPEPYLLNFTTRAIEIYRAGLQKGNRANVFTLVGDSNTANPAFFEAFDAGHYNLDQYGYLEETLRYYQGNFKLTSVAAVGGFNTTRLWEPERADPSHCLAGEGSLACEYRIKKPSVALILIGSNDRPLWSEFEANYRQLVEYTIGQGILPVLITKGDDTETQYGGPSGYINSIIRKLSAEYSVPLLDLRMAIDQFQLPNAGLEADNLHFNTPPDGLSADFNPEHLRYGYTLRNLTALQALDAVRRLTINA